MTKIWFKKLGQYFLVYFKLLGSGERASQEWKKKMPDPGGTKEELKKSQLIKVKKKYLLINNGVEKSTDRDLREQKVKVPWNFKSVITKQEVPYQHLKTHPRVTLIKEKSGFDVVDLMENEARQNVILNGDPKLETKEEYDRNPITIKWKEKRKNGRKRWKDDRQGSSLKLGNWLFSKNIEGNDYMRIQLIQLSWAAEGWNYFTN
jgi:hypothetical protein